jgi:hypothetical protein
LQNLAKYFGTGQRKQKLFDTQKLYSLQQGIPQIDGTTRVASCSKLFQTSVQHYFAMSKLHSKVREEGDDTFTRLWEDITVAEWELIMKSLT